MLLVQLYSHLKTEFQMDYLNISSKIIKVIIKNDNFIYNIRVQRAFLNNKRNGSQK